LSRGEKTLHKIKKRSKEPWLPGNKEKVRVDAKNKWLRRRSVLFEELLKGKGEKTGAGDERRETLV